MSETQSNADQQQQPQVVEQQQPPQVIVQQPVQAVQYSQVLTASQQVNPQPIQVPTNASVVANQLRSIKGESRVEYFPIETKTIEYEEVTRVIKERVPVTVKKMIPQQKVITRIVPEERIITDYQAVEYQKEYVPRVMYDTVTEQVPVEKTEYVPVQKVEYVAQEVTEMVNQSRTVEKVHYDEIEYQVQRPQVQQVQTVVQQPQQLVVGGTTTTQLSNSQIYAQQPQVYSSQLIQQPLYSSQAKLIATNVNVPTNIQVTQQPVEVMQQSQPQSQQE